MYITHLSIKNLTIAIMIAIAVLSVFVSFVSGEYFFKVAREAQLHSLNHVIQVATKDIMRDLHDQVYGIATNLSTKGDIPIEFNKSLQGNYMNGLVETLDDPFVTGFVGAYSVELVKVRAYDLEFRHVAESDKGAQNLPQKISDTLYQQGYDRKGVARTKAIAGLWQFAGKSYYSMLVPIGGIFIVGYLEVVVDPVVNLTELSKKMDAPIGIYNGVDPNIVYYKPKKPIENLLPVEYIYKTDSGAPAYVVTSYEDIAELSEGVNRAVFNTIAMFIALVLVVLIFALWLFQLFLFKPLRMMLGQIRAVTDGDFSRDLQVEGLAEIDILAKEFNKMAREVRSREEELMQLSVIDGLTKIANRRKFDETLKNEYLSGCRSQKSLSVLMIDIDYFKNFNDTYGHLAGDDCLKHVAAAIQSSVYRPTDLVVRYGGEEFAVILPDTPEHGEHIVAEKIMSEISRLNISNPESKVADIITVSIGGYTLVPLIDHDPAFIVAEADKSLYQAKGAGRNQFIIRSES